MNLTCPACEGDGFIEIWKEFPNTVDTTRMCMRCKGTGTIQEGYSFDLNKPSTDDLGD